MKQLDVQIMGQSYLLGCPDGGELQFREAVQRVDAAMCRIRDAGKVKARDRIAVLAALNLAFELSDLHQSATSTVQRVPQASAAATPSDENHDPALASLLDRVHAALGDDGHLL
jgi:cell division protein ZapA